MPSWDRLAYKLLDGLKLRVLGKPGDISSEMNDFVGNIGNLEKFEIVLVGEKLRQAVHEAGLIKNRRYHLRTYTSCFIGRELVDWLLKHRHSETRESAIEALRILQHHSLIHHVCDDHEVKDTMLFYRFRRDDVTYVEDKDLALFYQALDLYNGLSTRNQCVIRSYQQDGELYRNAFQGAEFVDFLVSEAKVSSREEGVTLGRRLLENDTIRHVTDDFHFRDDCRLLYQFTLDFSRRRHLTEVFQYVPRANDPTLVRSSCEFHTPLSSPVNTPDRVRRRVPSLDTGSGSPSPPTDVMDDVRWRSRSGDSGNETDSSETAVEKMTTRSVLLRHASVHELQSPDTPYVKQTIKIQSDPVGYGFVIRGDSPTYVQAVDPLGPASVAGLKVRQYIYSVNGQYVLNMDHKSVGKLIMQSVNHIILVVMTHKRDAAM